MPRYLANSRLDAQRGIPGLVLSWPDGAYLPNAFRCSSIIPDRLTEILYGSERSGRHLETCRETDRFRAVSSLRSPDLRFVCVPPVPFSVAYIPIPAQRHCDPREIMSPRSAFVGRREDYRMWPAGYRPAPLFIIVFAHRGSVWIGWATIAWPTTGYECRTSWVARNPVVYYLSCIIPVLLGRVLRRNLPISFLEHPAFRIDPHQLKGLSLRFV